MFTVEIDFDETILTIMDDNGNHEDFKVYLYDDIIIFKMFDEKLGKEISIKIGPKMWDEFMASLQSTEGTFILR